MIEGESVFTSEPTSPEPADETLSPLAEIEQLLHEDQSRLGDVYRLHVLERRSPQEVADELNVETSTFVYSYRAYVDAILTGKISSGARLRRQTASAIRSLIKRNRSALSAKALRILNTHLVAAEQSVANETAPSAEELNDEIETTRTADSLEGKPGIYAFSYGWYLENPADERSNTLIKIGRAEDVGARIRQHKAGARTHIPEPLVVVRVFSIGSRSLEQTERDFHRLLSTAGHDNPRRVVAQRNEVGKEWFLTNTAFLDAIATALGLRTEFIGASEFGD